MRDKFIDRENFAELSDEQYAELENEVMEEIRWHNRPIIVSGICFAITAVASMISSSCLLLYGGGTWDMVLIILNFAIMIVNMVQFILQCKAHNTEEVLRRVDGITENFCEKIGKANQGE